MLKVREHTCIDILETLARFAGNCSADTRKIIVVCRDARRRAARPEESEIIGFDQHLEESIIPANADAILRWTRDALTDTLVTRSDALKARRDFQRRLVSSITLGNKLHEGSRRNALRYRIVRVGDDWWQRRCAGASRNQK